MCWTLHHNCNVTLFGSTNCLILKRRLFKNCLLLNVYPPPSLSHRDLTENLQATLAKRGINLDIATSRDLKEKLGYVSLDYNTDMLTESSSIEKTYVLPNGKTITVGNERFVCTEPLFETTQLDGGMHVQTFCSILKCDTDIRKDLYSNIVLVGGSSMFAGIRERLQKEVRTLAPPALKVEVVSPPERRHSAWRGGSILASAPGTTNMWMTKQDYEEYGPTMIHRKYRPFYEEI